MRTKRLAFLFSLFAILAVNTAPLFAEESAAWYYGKPIRTINFEGLQSINASDLEGVTSGFIGKNFSDDIFADLLNRIYALDYFDEVTPSALPGNADKSSVTILFKVTERPIIAKIQFAGNKQVRTSELKETVTIKEKDIFIESKMLIDERALRDFYLGKGFTNVKVSSSSEKQEKGVVVTFTIDEGQPTVVAHIHFKGNQVVAEKTLKGKISLKEVSLFNKGAFQESMLDTDKQTIVTYYQNRGYVDATVLDILRETNYNENKKRDELTITFVVQEGSQYTFGGMTFTGNKVFSTEQLQSLVKIKTGSLFNQTKFQESTMAITDLYYENGYTANQFKPSVHKDTDTKVISYNIDITENPRSHIESILIKGNTRTKENVIRREIPIQEGDIFSKTKITTGLRNLYNLQYFSAIVPDVLPGSEDNLVNLVFNVEEQSTMSLEFGFTFSGVSDPDQLPISLYVKWLDSNLFGEGKSVSASTTLSTDEQSISLSYGENWLWGMPISTSVSMEYAHSNNYALREKYLTDGTIDNENYYMEYEQHKFSLSGALGHRWTPDFAINTLSAGITGSLIDNIYNSTLYTPVDTSIALYSNNWAPKNAVYTSFSMDGRDINYDPSKGWFFSQKMSWYGLLPQGMFSFAPEWGETEFYLRTDTKVEKYFTLVNHPITENWALKLVLMGYSGLSFQFPLPNTSIGQSSKMYIDGMFNGRGWSNYNSVRGQAMWSNNVELRMPIVPNVIALDLFFDAVTVKDTAEDFATDFFNNDDWYFSFGPGVRFSIPQFPLRLLLTNNFKFDDSGNVVWRNKYDTSDVNWYENWNFVLSFNLTNK
jgi:outer membrane protein insertion porin family